MYLFFKELAFRSVVNNTLLVIFISIIISSSLVFAQSYDIKDCASSTGSEWAYKECMAARAKQIDERLNKVLKAVQEVYKKDKSFLKMLEESQQAWSILCDANIALQFPLPLPGNSYKDEYGSAINACYMQLKEQCKLERIEFLKQWLIGSSKDVCSGSIMEKSSLKNILGDQYDK